MSSIGSPSPFFLAGKKKAYAVDRSLRFNRDDDAYLQATLGNSNLNKWTLSIWVKKPVNGEHQAIFSSGDSSVSTMVNFGNSDRLKFTNYPGSAAGVYITTRKFRDPSAWYHIVAIWDSGNATAGDRIRLYVNGVRETAFDQSDNPNQNQDSVINGNTQGDSTWGQGKHRIGRYSNYADNSGCYYAEVNFVDGQAYDPSYFAETNSDTGQWNPKKYVGSYGTNGFYLNFSDNSGTTATTLGKDSSGNGNNFTPNNFSVSAGTGNDSLEDTPTNNFPTINPLAGYSTNFVSASNGNLDFSLANNHWAISSFKIPASGKWYAECVFTDVQTGDFGVFNPNMINDDSNSFDGRWNGIRLLNGGSISVDNSQVQSSLTAITNNDIVGIKIDRDAGTVAFTINGSANGTAVNISGMVDSSTLAIVNRRNSSSGSNPIGSQNYGQRPFSHLPAGYKALSSANLPDPTILLPNKHFNTLLYTGNNGTQNITGLDFNPDWVWGKNRQDAGYHHDLYDTIRGDNLRIFTSQSQGEATGYLQFGVTGGFSLTAGGGINVNAKNHVAWCWNAGDTETKTYTVTVVDSGGNKFRFDGYNANAVTLDLAEGGTYVFNYPSAHPLRFSTTSDGTHGGGSEYTTGVTHNSSTQVTLVVASGAPNLYYYCASHSGMGGFVRTNIESGSSNFDGTIISDMKVNPTAGFSIVGYTGNGTADSTVGHGLGVAPEAVIVKKRSGTDNWQVYWIGAGTERNGYLSLTNAFNTPAQTDIWGTNVPTSTKFYVGTDTATNASGSTYVAYVFSGVEGYSKFGEYKGNGNDDGTFVYTGFRPAWVMIKMITGNEDWPMYDNKRDPFNVGDHRIFANTSGAEGAVGQEHIDFVSNGFKLRKDKNPFNSGSNANYLYFAFAKAPFKNSRAR